MTGNSDYWLLLNTSVSQYIVKVCYMHKHLNETSKREYHLDFGEYDRYTFQISSYKDGFKCKLLRCYRPLAMFDFDTPIEFCKKIWNYPHQDVSRFTRLILDNIGFKMCIK